MNACKINLSHKIKDNPEVDDFSSWSIVII